jgi:hypothetical protein
MMLKFNLFPVEFAPARLDGGDLYHDLVAVWEQHARSTRMATPILKTLHVLLSRGVLDKMCLKPSDADHLVDLIRGEGRKCSDATRLVCIADALCQLAVIGQGDVAAALQVRFTVWLLSQNLLSEPSVSQKESVGGLHTCVVKPCI